jgi:protein MpaA
MQRIPRGVVLVLTVLAALTALPALTPTGTASATAATAVSTSYVRFHRTIGHSVRGRPIVAYYRGTTGATHTLLLLGQMHGDEDAGPRTAAWAIDHVTPKAGTGIWVIATMNPDGNLRNTRRNARGVDLNRNWPTSGWRRTARGSLTYGGPRPASEPETRTMIRFLSRKQPDYIASIHQALHGIGIGGNDPAWLRRLHRNLGLSLKSFGVGNPTGTVSPTLTGWYDKHYGAHATATTIEYGARPSLRWMTSYAATGIARSALLF